ncbi:MAG: SDR family oxidoreductase [Bacteroidota bacterium]
MENKTLLITGANVGIGLETAKNLARTGATIVMMARNKAKGEEAVKEVKTATGNAKVFLQMIDLASMQSVRKAAQELLDHHQRIDVLINNAGLIKMEKHLTEDGFDTIFGVNHLGPYLLTRLLLDRIQETAKREGSTRVLFVSSDLHKRVKGIDFEDLNWESRRFNGIKAYGESKQANIMTANEIARRYGAKGVFAHSIHPGPVRTNIYRNGNIRGYKLWVTKLAYALVGISLAEGAATPTFLATSPEAIQTNGKYWIKSKIAKTHLPKNEAAVAKKLWEVSAQLTGVDA